MTFSPALQLILLHEGGYVNDERDAGGETKYGISKRAYPDLDIVNLTVEKAGELYKKDYWDACKCDELPPSIALMTFDFAVNAGTNRAIKTLQRTVGAVTDGIIGPMTIQAVKSSYRRYGQELLISYSLERTMFYTSIESFKHFGRGWLLRTFETLKYSLRFQQEDDKWIDQS